MKIATSPFAMIEEAGIKAIAHKAAVGTQMMIELYDAWLAPLGIELNTSRDAKERGGHISLVHPDAAQITVKIERNKIPAMAKFAQGKRNKPEKMLEVVFQTAEPAISLSQP